MRGGSPVNRPLLFGLDLTAAVDRSSPSTLNTRPRVSLPTGTASGAPVFDHFHAADHSVGRSESDATDATAAEVLLHFAGDVDVESP
jgi:hypothetical protein